MEGARSLSTSSDSRFIRQNSSEILAFLKQGNSSNSTNNMLPPSNGSRVFDPSEFPSLGRSTSSSGSSAAVNPPLNPLPMSIASVVMGGNSLQQRPLVSNDGLYSENFPALPQGRNLGGPQGLPQTSSSNPFTQAVHHQQQLQQSSTGTRHDLSIAGNYGLMGLMGVIRMEDPDRGSLALGTDLTTLGLNLNSSELLHTIFSGPWDDSSRETLFSLPASYPRRCTVRPEILEHVNLETLFVAFYSMPRDVLQVLAAQELVKRGWRFHEELRLWFSHNPKPGAVGSVVFFDVHVWEKKVFAGRLPEGFESGFLDNNIILNSSRLATQQLAQKGSATPSSGGGGGGGTTSSW